MSSSCKEHESDNAFMLRVIAAVLTSIVILQYMIPGQYGLFACLLAWQYIHMYIIGRKDITLGNFDGVDLLTGIPVLFFFFTCPGTYFLTFGLMVLITGRRSVRAY